jgi:hypothetical protein
MKITDRQTATVLAALRIYQFEIDFKGIDSIAGMNQFQDGHDPLTSDEVNQLCEAINFGDAPCPPTTEPGVPATPPLEELRILLNAAAYWADADADEDHPDPMGIVCDCSRQAHELFNTIFPEPDPRTTGTPGDMLPDDHILQPREAGLGDAEVSVPLALRLFARSQIGKPDSIAIASLYEDEAILCIDEQCPDERDELIADGWPERFVDFLLGLVDEGHSYIRLI